MKKRIHQIELFLKYPHEVQQEWFRKLIHAGRFTEWGSKYDYASINNIDDFRNRIPIQTYDSLKPYIDRLRQGEQRLLWNTEVKWFAKSSGTTSDKSKFIPVTNESLEECHFKGGKDMLSIYCNNHPETKMFNGKILTMGGSHQINSLSDESFSGDLSAILIQNLPTWIQLFRTPELSIALMDEWETKIDRMATSTIADDVTNISGVPSWILVLLRRILEITGKANITEVWPNLELVTHGAVNFSPYREQFDNLISNPSMKYYETYNASEGFFGIQDQPNSDELLLMLDYGIFYEFIPESELGKDDPRTFILSEVKPGVNYAMVISTNGGLWRYMIGDTVMFTSINPFRIKITGRTASFINAFGEELIVDNADKAILMTCNETNAILNDYTAAPVYFSENGNGAHEWFIEFGKAPDNIEEFGRILDNHLKGLNSDYEAKRYKDLALRSPIIRNMPKNTFYNWLKSKGKLGGQHKVPRLSNDRKLVEEIMETLSTELS